MKILAIQLQNFGSYNTLDFDFQEGLTLIQGANGSGKSTLMDAIPWILFGQTAKGGKADDIRSWDNSGTTNGSICIDGGLRVYRSRSPNDLWYSINCGALIRGRDLLDTQRLINQHLGLDCERYLSGAYYHEFSQTAQFFTTSAKNRREFCEQIVDLSLASTLQDKTKSLSKEITRKIETLHQKDRDYETKLSVLKQVQETEKTKAKRWEDNHKNTVKYVTDCYDKFEKTRKHTVSNQCRACGTVLAAPREVYDDSPNPHTERLAELESTANPHTGAAKDYSKEIADLAAEQQSLERYIDNNNSKLTDAEILSEVLTTFRSRLIGDTISYLQQQTNSLLEEYFDAELTTEFNIENDKLEVIIQKDGNTASYTQLSKGQRQLLRLCFSIATMRAVSNHSGVKLNQIFFDEALDGLSDSLKIKAYRLFESIRQEYEGVYVIDHSEALKALFDSQYSVTLVNGDSQIAKTV